MKSLKISILIFGLIFSSCSMLSPLDENPDWISSLIVRFEREPVGNPPQSIWRYYYKNQIVYFTPQQCCDQYSILYNSEGKIIGYPDGGFTGKGDGKLTDFFTERKNETLIWKDKRGPK